MAGKVFISYATPDFSRAETLCRYIEQCGIPAWMAPRDIPAGGYHGDAVAEAIKDARCVVLIFTSQTNAANFVKNELDSAIALKRRIIPVRLDAGRPTLGLQFLLASSQWVDAYQQADDDWQKWVAELKEKTGRSLEEWLPFINAQGLPTEKERRDWLKQEHGFGHGHANALVLDFLNEGTPQPSRAERIDRLFGAKKARWFWQTSS